MTRPRLTLAAALLALCLLPAATAQAVAGHTAQRGPSGHHDDGPDRIDLPTGWQPEGVTTDGKHVFSGSLATGSILRADPRTGATEVLPDSATGKPAVGIDYDKRRGVIWVAGGPSGEVRAQDARTGELLATYTTPEVAAPGRFLNDLVVTRHAVYATDSFNQELVVVRLGHGHGVPPSGPAELLPLTGDIVFAGGGAFNANGIVKARHTLVLVQSNTGLLFRVDRMTGEARMIDLGGALVTGGDGLEPGHHHRLYVVQNQGTVAVVHLARHALSGEVVDSLPIPEADVTSTGALVHHSLWVANARFGSVPDPTVAPFWLSRVAVGDDD
jgi:sugar lactone lactonase YvrE